MHLIFDSLKLFDAPDPNLVVGARKVTTVPAQALFLMNSPMVIEQSEKTAEFILQEPDQKRRIEMIYERLLGRLPGPNEVEQFQSFLNGAEDPKSRWQQAVHAIFSSGEFRTVY